MLQSDIISVAHNGIVTSSIQIFVLVDERDQHIHNSGIHIKIELSL